MNDVIATSTKLFLIYSCLLLYFNISSYKLNLNLKIVYIDLCRHHIPVTNRFSVCFYVSITKKNNIKRVISVEFDTS